MDGRLTAVRIFMTVLISLAVANFLAIGGFVGWLAATDRLDLERLEEIRTILAETRADEAARLEAEDQEATRVAQQQAEDAKNALPPLNAGELLDALQEHEEAAQLRVARMEREAADLRRALERERDELDRRVAAFEQEKAQFDAMRQRLAEVEGDGQFQQALALYKALPAAKAQEMLQTLIDEGRVDQVVDYLNAMDTRTARKIVERFEDPAVAADLLERLRVRGLQASAAEDP